MNWKDCRSNFILLIPQITLFGTGLILILTMHVWVGWLLLGIAIGMGVGWIQMRRLIIRDLRKQGLTVKEIFW